jgi:potassium-transporting ATPase KdpC subunit
MTHRPSPLANTPAQSSPTKLLFTALGMFAVLTLVTGVAYPLLITGIAKAAFAKEARGSLIEGTQPSGVRGSRLIGQSFESPGYFWGRLSATSPTPFNAGASTGSNLGPTNDAIAKAATARIEALRAADPTNTAPVPVDLVTSSASGLDPNLTPAGAEFQLVRVARARELPVARVRELVAANTDDRTFGILGEPRVNVVMLNVALDREAPTRSRSRSR